MKRAALWIYILTYAALAVAARLDPESRGTTGELVFRVAITLSILCGMIFYASGATHPKLIAAWKVVAPLTLLGMIARVTYGWQELTAPDPELSAVEQRVILAIALIAGVILVAPAIVMNFRFAMRRNLSEVSQSDVHNIA